MLVAHRDATGRAAALGDQDQLDAAGAQLLRLLGHSGKRVVRFAVREDDQHAVGKVGARPQQLPALTQRAGQPRSSLRSDFGIQRVEVERERRAVNRQRGEDVARAGECQQTHAIAVQILHQPARFAQRPPQPAGTRVLRQHRAGDIHRDHDGQGARFRHDGRFPPARARQRHHAQERGHGERRGPEASRADGAPHGFLGPLGRPPDTDAARPRGREPHRAAHQRRHREDDRRVERHQGTRTANVPATTISRASATSPRASGVRYASSNRRYTTCSTGVFSSRLISANTLRNDWASVARK